MTDKINGNDVCFCGSGKPYKKCCFLKSSPATEITDAAWHTLRHTKDNVMNNHLLPYVMQELPDEVVRTALEVFFPKELPPEAMDNEILFTHFFLPWLLFNWIPFDDFEIADFEPLQTIALNYMKVHDNQLDSAKRQFINAMNKTS